MLRLNTQAPCWCPIGLWEMVVRFSDETRVAGRLVGGACALEETPDSCNTLFLAPSLDRADFPTEIFFVTQELFRGLICTGTFLWEVPSLVVQLLASVGPSDSKHACMRL